MKKFLSGAICAASLILASMPALAWDGVNIDTGSTISVEDGTAISEGANIPIIDGETNVKRNVTISAISQTDSAIEIAVVDDTSGKIETYDFDPAEMPDTVELPEPK